MYTPIRIWKNEKIKWLINININYIRKFFAIEMHEFILINININYIRKFFAIEMLMLMTMTVEVEVVNVNAVQVYKNGLKSKYKII